MASPLTFKFKDTTNGGLEVGVDEAGRGCLLGPVYAAAVVWNPDINDGLALKIKDSKKLSPKRREELAKYIQENALAYGVGSVDSEEIDRINILNASMAAMHKALDQVCEKLASLPHTPAIQHIAVDGDRFKPYMSPTGDFIPHTSVVEGDNKVISIAAASILAKVHRDHWIADLLVREPNMSVYGIKTNQGYGSKAHMDAIKQHGITPHHRKSYKCCK